MIKEPNNKQDSLDDKLEITAYYLRGVIELPFRASWDLFIIVVAVWLEAMWLGFIFGSVVGVILLLIFMPEGFLLPLGLLTFLAPLWDP